MAHGNKLRRFFGINVTIDEQVDPYLLTYLKEKADKFAHRAGFDPEDHFVYIHNLRVVAANDKNFFGKLLPLDKRIERLRTTFRVNKKQARKPGRELIRFVDAFMLDQDDKKMDQLTETQLTWSYPGAFLTGGATFTTNIITWVSKALHRDDFRKVKLQVAAVPTDEYRIILKYAERFEKPTEFDLPLTYEKDIKFRLAKLTATERETLKREYDRSEKERLKSAMSRTKAQKEIDMEKNDRQIQPTISIGGSVSELTVISHSSNFSIRSVGSDGMQLVKILEAMLKVAQEKLPQGTQRTQIEEAIVATTASKGRSQFVENYKRIIDVIKPTYEIFADFIPRLTEFL